MSVNLIRCYNQLVAKGSEYVPLNNENQLYFPDSPIMDRLCTVRPSTIDVRVLYSGMEGDSEFATYTSYQKLLKDTPDTVFFEDVSTDLDMRVTRAAVKIKSFADLKSRLNGLRLTRAQNFE